MNELNLPATPGQTIGPFFGYALPFDGDNALMRPADPTAIRLHGTVFDGAAEPVPDALLEIWQATKAGAVPTESGSLHRDGYGFTGWGRTDTDRTGHYSFSSVRPGLLPDQDGAFISMVVFARGLLDRLFTRVYLPPVAADANPFLDQLPEGRRQTLVAREDGTNSFRFDIHLQGPDETVFLDFNGDHHG